MLKISDSFKSILAVSFVALTMSLGFVASSAVADPGFNNNTPVVDPSAETYTVVSKTPIQIESISSNSLCGRTQADPNGRLCIGEFPTEINANDTVSQLKQFLLLNGQSCAVDERGVRCWKTRGHFNKPMQSILSSGENTAMIRSAPEKICVAQADKTIVCYNGERGDWSSTTDANGTTTNNYKKIMPPNDVFGPYKDLRDFQVIEGLVCALDGDEINCNGGQGLRFAPPTQKFPGAKSISVAWDTICVLHTNGLSCSKGSRKEDIVTYDIGGWWKTATKLFPAGYETVCGVDAKEKPTCVRLGVAANEFSEATPALFTEPDVRVIKFMADGERMCGLIEKGSEPRSLVCGLSSLEVIPKTENIIDFSMNADVTCGVEKSGRINCYYNTVHMDSPLPEDGTKAMTSGLCRWNSSRFHCSSMSLETDFSDIKKVISATSMSDNPQLPCIIYENTTGARKLRCFGGSEDLTKEAPALSATDFKLVAGYGTACLYGGDSTTCWGSPIGNTETPNLSNAKKIAFSNDFACAMDQFGFVCWGARLDERELHVPPNMGDLDFVTDFSVGRDHVCAITREGRLSCWGKNDSGQLNVPPVTNPTSIASSGDTNCVSSDEGVTCWGSRTDALMKMAND